MAENLNPFEISLQQFDTAAEYLKFDPSLRDILKKPKRQKRCRSVRSRE